MYHRWRKLEMNQNVGLDISSLVTIKVNLFITIICMNIICATSWSHISKDLFFTVRLFSNIC
jgi:hypothetical protein